MEDRRRAAKLQEELHRKFSNSDSTHGGEHKQRNVHPGKAHKGGAQTGGAYAVKSTHEDYTPKSTHGKEHARKSVHTGRAHGGVNTGRAHTEEYTRGEHTWRSI